MENKCCREVVRALHSLVKMRIEELDKMLKEERARENRNHESKAFEATLIMRKAEADHFRKILWQVIRRTG